MLLGRGLLLPPAADLPVGGVAALRSGELLPEVDPAVQGLLASAWQGLIAASPQVTLHGSKDDITVVNVELTHHHGRSYRDADQEALQGTIQQVNTAEHSYAMCRPVDVPKLQIIQPQLDGQATTVSHKLHDLQLHDSIALLG
jgi:hypothetical protein